MPSDARLGALPGHPVPSPFCKPSHRFALMMAAPALLEPGPLLSCHLRAVLSSTLHVPFLARYGRPLPGTRAESKSWHEDPAPSPRRGGFLRPPCRSPAAGEGAIGNSGPGKSRAYRTAPLTTCAKSSLEAVREVRRAPAGSA